jgi:PAS domain S-box-containing protein
VKLHRSLRALLVDVPTAHATVLADVLADAGWRMDHEHADGDEAMSAALARRGWNAVLYGGDGPGAVPARKALALVRLADPHMPFLAVSPYIRAGDLSALIRGLDGSAVVVSDPAELPRALTKALDAARLRRRVGSAHHLLQAQQAITDHIAAGLDPGELSERVLATLGETLGWAFGAVWRPNADTGVLQCTTTWHAVDARAKVVAFAEASRQHEYAPGQGMPGRVYAFRRPVWASNVSAEGRSSRATQALRSGLMTAVAFPIAWGDDCAGVLEFFSTGIHEHNGEVAAMFATVGGQFAQYLQRRHEQAAESRRVQATAERTRGFLDAASAMIVVLDREGRVQLANARACTEIGLPEEELLGTDWFSIAVPKTGRAAARAAYGEIADADTGDLRHGLPSAGGRRRTVNWTATRLEDGGGVLLLGQVHAVERRPVAATG